jgi:hypothetical protein
MIYHYTTALRNLLRDSDQQHAPRLVTRRIVKMYESVALTQPIEPNTSPGSQRIATNFVIFDLEPARMLVRRHARREK